jgi:signal transduction histidine kinase
MLHEFIAAHRAELIVACREKIASRPAPRPTEAELLYGVPLVLEQLAESLRLTLQESPAIAETSRRHGKELLERGFTIAQVVHDYGGVCQAITELAIQTGAPITTTEFQALNGILDEAIAWAVAEYSSLREHEGTERMGRLAHELRNLLTGAMLAFDALQSGNVGVGGSTGNILGRSLRGLRDLIDRQVADVRLAAGVSNRELLVVRDFVEDVEASAAMDASRRGLELAIAPVPRDLVVSADRQILASVVANLLQNAFKFTPRGGLVTLRVEATPERVLIHVEDACGGLPKGKAQQLFATFEQAGADRSGLGLGLDICQRGAAVHGGTIHVADRPGKGCVFTLDVPRHVDTGAAADAP